MLNDGLMMMRYMCMHIYVYCLWSVCLKLKFKFGEVNDFGDLE